MKKTLLFLAFFYSYVSIEAFDCDSFFDDSCIEFDYGSEAKRLFDLVQNVSPNDIDTSNSEELSDLYAKVKDSLPAEKQIGFMGEFNFLAIASLEKKVSFLASENSRLRSRLDNSGYVLKNGDAELAILLTAGAALLVWLSYKATTKILEHRTKQKLKDVEQLVDEQLESIQTEQQSAQISGQNEIANIDEYQKKSSLGEKIALAVIFATSIVILAI